MPIPEKVKQAVRGVLEAECCKDKDGIFYTEIYADYQDKLSDKDILNISQADDPHDAFDEQIMENYENCEWDYEAELRKKIMETETIANAIKADESTEEEIAEFARDQYYANLPYEHFLCQNIYVDILINAGDLNFDYTLNAPFASWDGRDAKIIDENSGVLWLARQQGYTKTALTKALRDRETNDNEFLKSVLAEVENVTTSMNVLTFLVKMPLKEWFKLHDAISKEKPLNDCYFPRKSKGRGYIILDEGTTCGLYDPWNGAGSVLEIQLEKDVRLPIRMIDSAWPDGGRGYSINEIYGLCLSAWTSNAVKEIHEQKRTA
ncbi:MAG: hypothetical protein PHV82_08920 [Victivallaceae bacterium]|nr:hypothetical protein [Victivallaceae bacterium]